MSIAFSRISMILVKWVIVRTCIITVGIDSIIVDVHSVRLSSFEDTDLQEELKFSLTTGSLKQVDVAIRTSLIIVF